MPSSFSRAALFAAVHSRNPVTGRKTVDRAYCLYPYAASYSDAGDSPEQMFGPDLSSARVPPFLQCLLQGDEPLFVVLTFCELFAPLQTLRMVSRACTSISEA